MLSLLCYLQQVQLMCVGEGPVVHVDPEELDWGQTPVLSDLTKSVILSNESLIPAPFVCAMVSNQTYVQATYQICI